MNSKFTTYYLHLLGIWKSGNFVFGITLCLLRATELSQFHKNEDCDYYFVRSAPVLENGGTPINNAWLNSPTIVLCFLDSVEAQFRLLVSACLLKYYFFRLPSRLLFKSFQDLAFRGMSFWFLVLSVKVHVLFALNGELILITLNKQGSTAFVNLGGAIICFILCDIILSSKVCFDRMALRLLSVDRLDL